MDDLEENDPHTNNGNESKNRNKNSNGNEQDNGKRKRTNDGEKQQSTKRVSKEMIAKQKKERWCNKCGREGHFQKECHTGWRAITPDQPSRKKNREESSTNISPTLGKA